MTIRRALGHTCLVAAMSASASNAGAQTQAPPPGAATQMVRAAGMPLNDGALPPGSLTVRLVEGAFTGDLRGISVEADLGGGQVQRAVTGEKGRAEFAHVPVGARVRVSAVVRAERLQSETFAMPAESGVRVLLVAGPGDGAAGRPAGAAGVMAPSGPAAHGTGAPLAAGAPTAFWNGDVLVVAAFALATLLAAILMLRSRRRRRAS